MKTFYIILSVSCLMACKNYMNRTSETIVWVSGVKVECNSETSEYCLQIQNTDTPQLGQWKTWNDSIVNFIPKIGHLYKLKVSSTPIRSKQSSSLHENTQYKLIEVLEEKRDETILLNDIWGLSSIHGELLNTSSKRPRLELNVSKDQFLGFAFCNRISGQVNALNNLIQFSNIATTKMACKNLEYETKFIELLNEPMSFKTGKNQLILFNSQKKEVLRFKKLD